jgi:hypothetical protein
MWEAERGQTYGRPDGTSLTARPAPADPEGGRGLFHGQSEPLRGLANRPGRDVGPTRLLLPRAGDRVSKDPADPAGVGGPVGGIAESGHAVGVGPLGLADPR